MLNIFNYIFHLILTNPAPFVLIITITLLLPIMYKLLYTYLNIPRSLPSFVYFSMNVVILCLYVYGIIYTIIKSLPNPIYLENLSLLSYYRYALLSLIATFVLVFNVICYFKNSLQNATKIFKVPFLQEELRFLLHKAFSQILGSICIWFLDLLYNSKIFRYCYFTIDYIINHIYKLILGCLFLNFCLFHGDFRVMLYLIPLSFIAWIFSILKFYLMWFISDNTTYISNVLEVSVAKNPQNKLFIDSLNAHVYANDLRFKITPYGLFNNYNEMSVPFLIPSWVQMATINCYFNRYQYLITYLPYIFLLLSFSCWLLISFTFIYDTSSLVSFGIGDSFYMFIKRGFHATTPLKAPPEARLVKEKYAYHVQTISKKQMTVGHLVYGEITPDGKYFRIDGSLTHGNVDGKTEYLYGEDLNGIVKQQHHIPFDSPLIIPLHMLNKVIPNSIGYLSRDDILNKLGPKSKTAVVLHTDKLPAHIYPNPYASLTSIAVTAITTPCHVNALEMNTFQVNNSADSSCF